VHRAPSYAAKLSKPRHAWRQKAVSLESDALIPVSDAVIPGSDVVILESDTVISHTLKFIVGGMA